MADAPNNHVPVDNFTVPSDGGRPIIEAMSAGKRPKFRPRDKVWIMSTASNPERRLCRVQFYMDGKYKLCDESGVEIDGGCWFGESELEAFNPFE